MEKNPFPRRTEYGLSEYVPLTPGRLQPITQRHQFVYFGDDAVLLSKRGQRHDKLLNTFDPDISLRRLVFSRCRLLSAKRGD